MRPAALLACVVLLGSCSLTLEDDILDLRADIREMEEQIPPEAPLWIAEGPDRFDQYIEDYGKGFPDFIYRHIVRKLHGMPAPEVDSLAEGPLNVDAVMEDPAKYRGKFWRSSGTIGILRARPIGDRDFPVKMTHEGVFIDDAGRPVLFHVVSKPDVLILRRDLVVVSGMFVQMVEYETASGRRTRAPFIIGKILRRFL